MGVWSEATSGVQGLGEKPLKVTFSTLRRQKSKNVCMFAGTGLKSSRRLGTQLDLCLGFRVDWIRSNLGPLR